MALEDQQGFGNGRCAWDLVAVLHAVRPDSRDYYSISGEGDGRCNVDFFGANTWQDGDISGKLNFSMGNRCSQAVTDATNSSTIALRHRRQFSCP